MQSETQITFPHWLPNFMDYKEVLIGGFAIVGVLLILSTVGMITIAAGVIENLNYVNIMEVFAALSYYSLIALISILVIPFSVVATIIIVVIEIFWVVVFNKYANWDHFYFLDLKRSSIGIPDGLGACNSAAENDTAVMNHCLSECFTAWLSDFKVWM